MLTCQIVYNLLRDSGVDFYAGVPDSLLKNFCAYITDHSDTSQHIIAANEGSAVALAAGHYLATGRLGLVYLQNSGQGNAINPLMSLADPDVYSIPMLLMIGWRGEPGKHDEPQHVKQGKVTLELLQAMGIEYVVLPAELEEAVAAIENGIEKAKQHTAPFAFVVRKGTFDSYKLQTESLNEHTMTREQAVSLIAGNLAPTDIIVSTTGKTSRELFEYRVANRHPVGQDFLTVGSMGHASQIALRIAECRSDRQVFCIDGDGAVIMHMGALATIGGRQVANLKHIVVNNGAHESVGGQPTVGFDIDIPAIANACGYQDACLAENETELTEAIVGIRQKTGPVLLEVRVNISARADLGRPTSTPLENKESFMSFVQS